MVSTTTGYRSPVRLVEHAGEPITPFSQQHLSRAKKKLLAEIALTNDELEIDGVSYSRNDVVTALDWATESNWAYHSIIFSHEGLLRFLEKSEFDAEAMKAASPYRYKSDFVAFVSPAFAHAFHEVSGRLLRASDEFEGMSALMDDASFILPENSHDAYGKVRTYLDELIYTIKNLSWEKFQRDESVLHFVFMPHWIAFVNKLPSEYSGYRDSIVEHMISLVWHYQRQATWYYLREVCARLRQIECSPSWKEEVERFAAVMQRNSEVESKKPASAPSGDSGDGPSVGRIIFWVVWIIFALVRIARCNDNNNRYSDFKLDSNEFSVDEKGLNQRLNSDANERGFKQFLDSLNRGTYNGKSHAIKNGATPIPGMTRHPSGNGSDTLFITNESGKDAILLCFDSELGLVDSLSRVEALYLRNGGTAKLNVPLTSLRLNVVFGENWVKLAQPMRYSLKQSKVRFGSQQEPEPLGALTMKHYFARPDSFSGFLRNNIQFSNQVSDASPQTRILYIPGPLQARKEQGNGGRDDESAVAVAPMPTSSRPAKITLVREKGGFVIRGAGNWVIYEDGPKFGGNLTSIEEIQDATVAPGSRKIR